MTMDNTQFPPPMPRRRMSLGLKIVLLAIQCGLLMIGALIIWIMSYSRDERNREVSSQIAWEWGRSVYVGGPVAMLNPGGEACVRPSAFTCDAKVETQSLHRNIYEAEVFNANVKLAGSFHKDSVAALGDDVCIALNVETVQITELSGLKIGGKTVEWSKSADCLYANVDVSGMPEIIEFSTDFDIRGSEAIYIKQIGEKSTITIGGEASDPSFQGRSLPNERSVKGNQFSARWKGEGVAAGVGHAYQSEYVGIDFLIGVDRYRKVSRSLKYAFLIILLTYITVLFTEITMKRDIPLLNYFLIGAALILFYSLLLSFAEHLSFGVSYLIASVMTVALISGYMWKMLSSRKVGLVMGGILTWLYASCYILLSLSTYSLIMGSLILFIALGAMMYGSLQVKCQ